MESSPTGSVSADVQRMAELVQDAARHAIELLRAEVALAKDELRQELQVAKRRALSLLLGALFLQSGITLIALGFVFFWGATATAAFASGAVLAAMALGAALYGVRTNHVRTTPNTQDRLIQDAERVAKAIS